MYEKIFEEGKIGGLTLRNRVILSPMDDDLSGATGEISDRAIEYYAAKAKGGTGLVIVGYVGVCGPELGGVAKPGQCFLRNLHDRRAFSVLADRVHEYGGKCFVQLNHPGRKSRPVFNDGHIPFSATALPSQLAKRGFDACRELTIEQIQELEDCFASAAEHAYIAGVDGVEIHCAHWFLMHQFISPVRNERTDEYGGSMENRCRIVVETIQKIRQKTPRNFPVTIRLHILDDEGFEGDLTIDDYIEIAQYFEKNGVDAIHFSIGTEDRTGAPDMKAGWRDEYFKRFKEALNIPIYGPNEVKHPDEAEKILEQGYQDFIIMGRQHSADPEWCNKAKSGHVEDIRPCINCNFCVHHVTADESQIRCAVNPTLGREIDNLLPLKKGEGTVVIIGAGPAGIQSALTLADRGYKVVLCDKRKELCGSLNLANKAPNKFRMDNLIAYYKVQISKRTNIELRLNYEVTPERMEQLKLLNPYAVIYAGGGKPIAPASIPGIEKGVPCFDVLNGVTKFSGKHVAVIGGGMTGLETAERLAEDGNKVTVIEMSPVIGNGIYFYNVRKTRRILEGKGAEIKTSTALKEIKDGSVVVEPCKTNLIGTALVGIRNIAGVADAVVEDVHTSAYEIAVDAAVLSLGIAPESKLVGTLKEHFDNVIALGDCVNPGRIGDATGAAYLRCKNL